MITVIPAIDLIEGKCVRLTQGDYSSKKVYRDDPLAVAKEFEQAGLKRLHIVDLDGARTGMVKNLQVLESIAAGTTLMIDFGGGIRIEESVQAVFDAGATMVTLGSIVVKESNSVEKWVEGYGPDKFLIGADVKNEKIAINGWTEGTNLNIIDLLDKWIRVGMKQFFCTDINRDGMMEGPAIDLYEKIMERFPGIDLIASGGVRDNDDVMELERIGCSGVIIGKAIYESKLDLKLLTPET